MKNDKKVRLTEGTGNFVPPPSGLPLLVGMTLDEYDNYVELYGEEEYTPDCIVLDDETIASIQDDISDFLSKLSDYNADTYYSGDNDSSYEIYTSNMYAIRDGNEELIELVDGYYEGVQVLVRESFNDLSNDLKKKVEDFLDYLQFKYALTKVSISSTSNGEQFISKQNSDYGDLDEIWNVEDDDAIKESLSENSAFRRFNKRKQAYRLSESNKVSKVLWGDYYNKIRTFAIIRAENPLVMTMNISSNRERTELLKKYLKDGVFQAIEVDGEVVQDIVNDFGEKEEYPNYKKIDGMYEESEHSFMIMNISLKSAKAIAKTFGQESFFYGKVTQITDNMKDYRYTTRATTATIEYWKATKIVKNKDLSPTISDYKLIEVSNRVNSVNDALNYYSKYKGNKFTIKMKEFESLCEILDEAALEHSLDDSVSGKNQYLARQLAYKK